MPLRNYEVQLKCKMECEAIVLVRASSHDEAIVLAENGKHLSPALWSIWEGSELDDLEVVSVTPLKETKTQ